MIIATTDNNSGKISTERKTEKLANRNGKNNKCIKFLKEKLIVCFSFMTYHLS